MNGPDDGGFDVGDVGGVGADAVGAAGGEYDIGCAIVCVAVFDVRKRSSSRRRRSASTADK